MCFLFCNFYYSSLIYAGGLPIWLDQTFWKEKKEAKSAIPLVCKNAFRFFFFWFFFQMSEWSS